MEKKLFPDECMFINCFYTYGDYSDKNNPKPDSIIVIWKDKDGNKGFTKIDEPTYTYYVTKDIPKQFSKLEQGYEYRYISLEDVIPVKTKYSNRYKSMSEHTIRKEVKDFYKSHSGKFVSKEERRKLEQMHLYNEFHGSDVNITDYYIDAFCQQNDPEKYTYELDLATYDIEVAGADYKGFPNEDEAPCEVNMITYYNFKNKILNVYMLNYDTETFKELTNVNIRNKVKEIKETYTKYFGKFKINVKIRSSELNLINDFFKQVNEDKPDYNLAWNARFDIITLKNRLELLLAGTGIPIEEIMCPSDFPIKKVIIKKDDSKNAKNDFTARTDTYNIYGYTVWLDMMVLYGNITRPQGKKESYSLNSIGQEEIGLTKEDLSAEDTSIKSAYLDNYTLFFKYSCIDTLLLALIVKNTGFINLLHTIVTLTHTRASKALTKTVCLRNYVNIFYRNMGYTISNNRCRMHFFDKESISGAYVAPPENIDLIGSINGIPSNKCFDLVIDEDLSSMYPNILITFNISSSTAEFRIIMKYHTGKYEIVNVNGKDVKQEIVEDITKDFIEKYLSEDVVSYCKEFHNLPDYDEMYEIFSQM